MSKKTFNLITGITGGIATITTAVIAYFQPSYVAAIVASIGIAETALIECFSLFTKE